MMKRWQMQILPTVENRSRVTFPPIQQKKAEVVMEEKSALKWEPMFASIEDETANSHTDPMYINR